jgi:diaminopimelate decarboxylase
VYSSATLTRHVGVLTQAFAKYPALLCYSVKANSNLAVLALFAKEGLGFDIVSGGELYRVLRAGGDPRKVVFSGVGKTDEELDYALAQRILMFNVESEEELVRLAARARRQRRRAPVALRVNPEVDARTHPYISTGLRTSKFGIAIPEAGRLYRAHQRGGALDLVGLDCHIGSQLTDLAPVAEALERVTRLFLELRTHGLPLRYLDVGGGLGITYQEEVPPPPRDYARTVRRALQGIPDLTLILEPGRVLVGNAGVLLTRVLYRKQQGRKRFAVVDAGMNDILRPALYGAHHAIIPLRRRGGAVERVDVVGPVCESTDVLGVNRDLPALHSGEDILALQSAGAYGMSMASNYNSRPRPAEVLVAGRRAWCVRSRETLPDLVRHEVVPSALRGRRTGRLDP